MGGRGRAGGGLASVTGRSVVRCPTPSINKLPGENCKSRCRGLHWVHMVDVRVDVPDVGVADVLGSADVSCAKGWHLGEHVGA